MAYDSDREVTVMFGGRSSVSPCGPLSDTWEFDGTSWTQVVTAHAPEPRFWHAMVYDSTRQRMVLYGGYGPSYPSGTDLSDTWEYDGFNWTQVTPTHFPGVRTQYGMSYDSTRKQVLLFGGIGDTSGDDTWAYIDQLSSAEQADNILRLIDYAVADGSLEGSGPGKSAGGRLGALINMIEHAEELIADDFIPEACQQLLDAKLKTDGLPNPADFVSGPQAIALEQLIQDLLDSMGC